MLVTLEPEVDSLYKYPILCHDSFSICPTLRCLSCRGGIAMYCHSFLCKLKLLHKYSYLCVLAGSWGCTSAFPTRALSTQQVGNAKVHHACYNLRRHHLHRRRARRHCLLLLHLLLLLLLHLVDLVDLVVLATPEDHDRQF